MANPHIPHWLRLLGFPLIVAVLGFWFAGRGWLVDETRHNDEFEPPSGRQLRWDIRHIREDLHMLVLVNFLLLALLIYKEFFR